MPYGPSISEGSARIRYRRRTISDSDRIVDETPETPRHPPGDTGEPQGKRRAPAFVRHHQTGAGFDSQPDDDMMMMIEILKRMGHNLIRPMYDCCITFMTVFRIRSQPPLLGSIHDVNSRNFFSTIGGYVIRKAHFNFVSASG